MQIRILLSHAGKQHAYHVAVALQRLGALQRFYTSSYLARPGWQALALRRGSHFWRRRFEPGLAAPEVVANWRFELPELLLRPLLGKTRRVQNLVYWRDAAFDAYMAKQMVGSGASHFWGFQGSCYDSLLAARTAGMQSICELATAHVTEARRILGEEAKLQPAWADSIDNLVFPVAYERRLQEEPHRADRVLAASEFTRQSLLAAGVGASKIDVLPLGFDLAGVPFGAGDGRFGQGPLRLLYAGTVTQRKGMAYLLEAVSGFSAREVRLQVVGSVQGSGQAFWAQREWFDYRPAVSQGQLFELYGQYDALVLPTLFEGFGLVIVEAMAAGLPVITTPHSMGPEVIREGENGYLVPIRSVLGLRQAIEALRQKTPTEYAQMRLSAREAALRYTWEAYRGRLERLLAGWE